MTQSTLFVGDAAQTLKLFCPKTVQSCICSPPYYNLRNYKNQEQIGQEQDVGAYVDNLAEVFDEVYRVLKDDGTLWLNLGDCYKKGNLLGVPWLVAFELKKQGWILRSDIVWTKPNVMPTSVKNRPTSSHEFLFLFSKNKDYYYNKDAILEPLKSTTCSPRKFGGNKYPGKVENTTYSGRLYDPTKLKGRNKRDVWEISTSKYKEAHFATFPKKLVEPCILAGSREGDIVLDPFSGAGTTGIVAINNKRLYYGIDLSEEYVKLSRERILKETNQDLLIVGGEEVAYRNDNCV